MIDIALKPHYCKADVIGSLSFFNADNLEIMRCFGDNEFDLAIVDPPYRDDNQPTKDMRKNGSMKSLEGRPTEKYWEELYRVSKNQIIWGANNFQLPQFKGFVVWDKGIPEKFTMSMAEIASLSEGLATISKIFKYRASGQGDRIHPTQKPIALYDWIIKNYSEPNNKILDTHLGSGSIAIAIEKANRLDKMNLQFVGIEIDKEYYEKALNRIEQYCRQGTLSF